MKTLLLGLDGLDPALVEQWDLPNIESIGEAHEIDTYGNSGPSWATVMTGLRPRDHGVDKLRPQQDIQSWEGEPIWEKVDGYAGVANVPLTYPPQELRGWMVTGMMTPRRAIYTYPRKLHRTLDELDYRVDIWVTEHENHPHGAYGTIPFEFSQQYREELLDEAEDVLARRGDAYVWLLNNEPVDFAFLCFTVLDRVQHLAFDDQGVVREFYERVDAQVGRVLEAAGGADVVACSDHGFQRIDYPDSDITGEHREEGWAATTLETDEPPTDLHDIHDLAVASANHSDVASRLEDLGYL